jgi:hypothetical protein
MDAILGALVPKDRPEQSADNRIPSTDSTMPRCKVRHRKAGVTVNPYLTPRWPFGRA